MTKTKTLTLFMVILLLILLFMIASTDLFIPRGDNEVYDISVIVNDSNGDSWTNFRSGMEQASKELNANISFITLYNRNSLEQQIVLLNREIDGGADAVLISAANGEGLSRALDEMEINTPIIAIGSNANAKQIKTYISADNVEMGEKLGEEIVIEASEDDKVLIIKNSMSRSNILERYEGLLNALNKSINNYEVLDINELESESEITEKLSNVLSKTTSNIIVALDESILEASLDVAERLNIEAKIKLFGIGHTNRIVYSLEMETINGIVVQNMFNVGYLGIEKAIEAVKQKPLEDTIVVESGVINKNNMYSTPNQRLLFPVP